MIVVSDTSPIHYLLLIDQVELLQKLYGRIAIP
jgi:predicted nucleic acid-binding protein